MNFNSYQKYKDSGINWIGEIPEDWEIVNLKYCSDIINEKKDFGNMNDKFIGLEHIESKTGLLLGYSNKGSDSTVYKFKKNMVLFGKLRPYLAKVINTSFDGVCSTELLVFKTNKLLIPRYLFYFMLSNMFIEQVNSSTYGVKMPRASPDFINSLPIAIPNKIEQKEIVRYLDSETNKIYNLINKNKQLIKLLKEKHAALINHVVTKGLNSDVPMKYSGVKWIGEIPEHWEIIKLKNCTNLINDKKDFADENEKYIGLEHIESETGKLLNYSNEGADGAVNKFKKNMILFGKLRPYLAKVINTSFDGVCSTELLVFSTNESLISRYLFYFMLSNRFIEQVNSSTYGVKMPRASPDFINNLSIALPNTNEQKEIIIHLDSKINNINNIISKIKENINLLEEYRSSLIHHVVTGKIDVRGEEI